MVSKKVIGVRMPSGTEWHVPGVSNRHDTLCGVDAHDGARGHAGTVPAMRAQKVTCIACRDISRSNAGHCPGTPAEAAS